METCKHHEEMVMQMAKRPTMMNIWSVVGILMGICVIILTTSFASIRADVEKIQVSAEKIQESTAENTLNLAVMLQDYATWKRNAPPYHTHMTDGRITKP